MGWFHAGFLRMDMDVAMFGYCRERKSISLPPKYLRDHASLHNLIPATSVEATIV